MVGGQIKGRNGKNLVAETPASSAERRRRAISTIVVSLFCNDQARGNFAYQSDQELALALCGGNSVRTVQMQTYVTSASAIAQFASNQLVGRLCDSCGRRPLLVGMPLLMALLRLCVVARPCWPTLFMAELASYMMFQVQMTPIEAALGDLYPEADALAKASSRVYSTKVSRGSRKLLAGTACNLLPTLPVLHPRHLLTNLSCVCGLWACTAGSLLHRGATHRCLAGLVLAWVCAGCREPCGAAICDILPCALARDDATAAAAATSITTDIAATHGRGWQGTRQQRRCVR
jgi:MFS family permease